MSSTVLVADYTIDNYRVTGISQLTEKEVREVLTPYLQGEPHYGDYVIAAHVLEDSLRMAGAFAARVYVNQDEKEHTVFQVFEGQLAEQGVALDGSASRVDDEVIVRQLEEILEPGSAITGAKYERAILLTNDLPGLAGSVATLYPAEKVGEASFELHPVDGQLFNGHVYADNFGSYNTGQNRLGTSLDINSPMGLGDKISLGGNVSDEGTVFVYLDGSIPVMIPGLRFGFTFDALDYKTNLPMGVRGDSQHASAYLHYPFIRSRQLNVYSEFRIGRASMEDKNDISIITDRKVDLASIRLYGDRADYLLGGGVSKFDVEVVTGDLDLSGFADYEQEDAQTAKTAGSFSRMAVTLSRLQHITGPWQSYLEVAGQLASKRLDASQSIAFGGPHSFQGYHSGDVLGDEGWRLHGDIRYNVPNSVFGGEQQWSVFYGYGRLSTHAKAIVAGIITPGIDEVSYTMQSAGFGFSQNWKAVQLQGVIGWQVNNEIPDALLDKGDANVLGWLHLVYNF